jgi:hypothetical protein
MLQERGLSGHFEWRDAGCIRERTNLREKTMAGLTAEQYTQTVAVLEQMAANLTPA